MGDFPPLGRRFELRDSLTLTPDPVLLPGTASPALFRRIGGLRGRLPGPGQTCRILALGGSSTECFFLDESKTWPALLERKLNRLCSTDSFWVGNAGYSGAAAADHLQDLPDYYLRVQELDAVIILVGINDLCRALAAGGSLETEEDNSLLIDRWQRARHFLWKNSSVYALAKAVVFRQSLDPDRSSPASGGHYELYRRNRRKARGYLDRLPARFDYSLAEYENHIGALIRLARKLSLRPIFLTQPTAWDRQAPGYMKELFWFGWTAGGSSVPDQDYYSVRTLREGMDLFNESLKRVCLESGAELYDLAAIQEPDTTMFYDDCHFNNQGARKAADFTTAHFLGIE
ncbi:MAG: hypothetical protein JXQ83_03520 [Candidatus Glassbacteria bacterium]|nr:hypothetical protein [Candidatus Glassbacteria bacterium]